MSVQQAAMEVMPAFDVYLDLDNYNLRHRSDENRSALHLAVRDMLAFDADSVASGRIAVYH